MIGHTGETIVALATPKGRGAIAQIRISGASTAKILAERFVSQSKSFLPRQSVLGHFHASNDITDQVVVVFCKGPNSYTGEDLAEVNCHGNPLIYKSIVSACIESGARMAFPGEFTYRAFLNGKIDLSQAEAVADLVDSQTEYQLHVARQQHTGALSRTLQPFRERLIEVVIQLETEIEFVEEDVATMEREGVLAQLKEVQSELEQLAKTFDQGKILTEGIRVVLSGRPNTGKSSIFNKLLKYERAIVTPYAGTTRDTLLEKLDIEGIPVLLIDTAGIREGLDPIEEEGVIRSKQNLRDADLALLVLDSQDAWTEEDEKVWKEVRLKPYLVVRNKIDLVRRLDIPEYVSEESAGSIEISAKEGKNLHNLALSIIQTIAPEWGRLEKEGILITHLRHQKALLKSSEEIGKGIEALKAKLSEEYALFDLKNALGSLGEITGETTSEEILGRIFSTFCIGK